ERAHLARCFYPPPYSQCRTSTTEHTIMKRAILRLPQGLRFDDLQPEQQAAIMQVFAQFTLPMPGTIAADGYELVDGVTGDNFDPSVMPGLGMDWPVVGLWQWDGRGDLVEAQ